VAWFGRGVRGTDRRSAAGRRRTGEGAGGAGRPDPGATPNDDDDTIVIDVTDRPAETRSDADAARAEELAARFRARRERREAEAELRRLRSRHWSGERLVEEACQPLEWWEHPDADPYAVLGILPGARLEEAAAARRRIAQRCHPDRTGDHDPSDDEPLRRMIAANGAYERIRRALRPVS